MPCYRFAVHGQDTERPDGERGFYTSRVVTGRSQADAEAKLLAKLRDEVTGRTSAARLWKSGAPRMEIERAEPARWSELFAKSNAGFTFYDEGLAGGD